MNYRDALRALADGKRIRGESWDPGEYIELVYKHNEYRVINETGEYLSFSVNAYSMFSYELYSEPNPHTAGTFSWAKFEALRGNRVRRKLWATHEWSDVEQFGNSSRWPIESFEATDWQLVSKSVAKPTE